MPALCLLYFGFSDIFRNVGLVVKERDGSRKLNSIIKYAQNVTRYCTVAICNKLCLLRHFFNGFKAQSRLYSIKFFA